MKLRWLILCDKNGVKTDPTLQYRDQYGEWVEIDIVEEKTEEDLR